jgi:secreted trypsin-like serine protease
MKAIYFTSILFAVAGSACVDGQDLSTTDQAIIKGEPTSAFPSVVALYGKAPGADKGALCTATVVGPNVVLTAAHCVDPAVTGANDLVYNVLSGADLKDSANPPVRFAVKEVHWDKQFSSQALQNGHDVAVAITVDPIPLPAMPVNLKALDSAMNGAAATLVGYGLNDGFNQTGAGVKRTAQSTMKFDDKFVKTGQFFGATICNGDSGGPILADINGTQTVVGVNSFGFIYCLGEASSTRVDTYSDWVSAYLTE